MEKAKTMFNQDSEKCKILSRIHTNILEMSRLFQKIHVNFFSRRTLLLLLLSIFCKYVLEDKLVQNKNYIGYLFIATQKVQKNAFIAKKTISRSTKIHSNSQQQNTKKCNETQK